MANALEGFLWGVLESNRAERLKMPGGGLSVLKHPTGVFSEEPGCRGGSEGARLCGGAYWSRTSDLLPVKQAF